MDDKNVFGPIGPGGYQLDLMAELRRVAKPEGVMGWMMVNPSVD